MSTTNYDPEDPGRRAKGVTASTVAGSGQIVITDGTTEVDAYQVSITGGRVTEDAEGIADLAMESTILILKNNTAGTLLAGDVVVVDSTANEAATTTTTARDTRFVGIVQTEIVAAASGPVLVSGYADLVNVTASVTRGNYAETSTTAKQATESTVRRSGSFGMFLIGGTTPTAYLWGTTDSAGPGVGGGALVDLYYGNMRPFDVNSAAANPAAANRAVLLPFIPFQTKTVTTAYFRVNNSTGNMDIGIYDASFNRLVSTGSFAVPASGNRTKAISFTFNAGIKYWIAFAVSSSASTFYGLSTAAAITTGQNYIARAESSFALPDPITITAYDDIGSNAMPGVWFA